VPRAAGSSPSSIQKRIVRGLSPVSRGEVVEAQGVVGDSMDRFGS
jgi:hypothetical protein